MMSSLRLAAVLILVFFGNSGYGRITAATDRAPSSALPAAFVENRGQLDPAVLFTTLGVAHPAMFSKTGAVFHLGRETLELMFVEPSGKMRIEGARPGEGRINYLRGRNERDWITNARVFDEVMYRDVWPGIDVRFRLAERRIKYEMLVHSGARLSDIRLRYDGAKGLSVDRSGDLLISTPSGIVTDERPATIAVGDTSTRVGSRFVVLDDTTFTFAVDGKYDQSRLLLIDPGFVFATYLGGGSYEDVTAAIATGQDGSVYLTGYAGSGNFPTTPGAFQRTYKGTRSIEEQSDAFVVRLTPDGSRLLYGTFIGGDEFDGGTSIAVDSAGYAYMGGSTQSEDYPVTPGSFQTTLKGERDFVVTKIDPTGSSLAYSTMLGGSNSDWFYTQLAIDQSGNAYITGSTSSPDFPTTEGAYRRTFSAPWDSTITKLNASGSGLVYSTFIGPARTPEGTFSVPLSIDVDDAGSAYLAGSDVVIKMAADGSRPLYWTTQGQNVVSIAVSAEGTAYTSRLDCPGGTCDVLIARLDSDGNATASYRLAGSSNDSGHVALDRSGNVLVGGATRSSDFPTTSNALVRTWTPPNADAYAGFAAKLTGDLSQLLYSTFLPGASYSQIAVAPNGDVCLLGGTSLPMSTSGTPGSFLPSTPGGYPAYIARLVPDGDRASNATATASSSESPELGAANAIDTNFGTRWSSQFSDPQYLQLDLGQQVDIGRVILHWEAAFATAYTIQVSEEGHSWRTIYHTEVGDGGVDDISQISGIGRYVRVFGLQRATEWGYSLWEVSVFGATGSTATQRPAVTMTSPPNGSEFTAPATITVSADASDPDGVVTRVEFFANDKPIGIDTSAPYSISWNEVVAGNYSLQARAVDDAGADAFSAKIDITVHEQAGTNIALHKPTFSSSNENASLGPENAVDGDLTTRWSSSFQSFQWMGVYLIDAADINRIVLRWETAYASNYRIQTSFDGITYTTIKEVLGSDGGVDDIPLATTAKYVRVVGDFRATPWGISLYEFEIYGTFRTTRPPNTVNLALNRPSLASSVESASYPPSNAFDGQGDTRWSSAFQDNQWIQVDLGDFYNIGAVVLDWEAAYAKTYGIYVSSDGQSWFQVTYNTNGVPGKIGHHGLDVWGRYLRVYGFQRGTPWGVSLWELEVYGR